MEDPSFKSWMADLRELNDVAVQRLWDRYFRQLMEIARRKLPANKKRAYDEEDVALSAMDSFCRGVGKGRFPMLNEEGNLWALLVLIVARKVSHRVRDDHALKRGGGKVQGESAFANTPGIAIHDVVSREPTPEFAAQLLEETYRLYDTLGDENLRQIAMLKMEGLTNREVADRVGCVERTVERRLQLIRQMWVERMGDQSESTSSSG